MPPIPVPVTGDPVSIPGACAASYNLTVPRIERCEKDLDSLFTKLREVVQRLDGVSLSHDDSVKRLMLMENALRAQQVESARTHLDIESLKSAVRTMGERVESIVTGMNLLAEKFDAHNDDFKKIFIDQAKAHEEAVRRHAILSRRAIQVAAALAMTGIAFTAVHAAITGESIFASLASYLGLLLAK